MNATNLSRLLEVLSKHNVAKFQMDGSQVAIEFVGAEKTDTGVVGFQVEQDEEDEEVEG